MVDEVIDVIRDNQEVVLASQLDHLLAAIWTKDTTMKTVLCRWVGTAKSLSCSCKL